MPTQVSRVDVWAATIEDHPGGLHEKLRPLADAGASLAFVIARRTPDKPGPAVVYVTPVRGAKVINAAKKAGFQKTEDMPTLCVEGADRVGLGADITKTLADAGLNLHGFSGAAFGEERSAIYISFDSVDDTMKAARLLRKI